MPNDGRLKLNLDYHIDETWLYRPGDCLKDPRVERDALGHVISVPKKPDLSNLVPNPSFAQSNELFLGIDHGSPSSEVMYFSTTASVDRNLKRALTRKVDEMIVKDLTDRLYRELEIPSHLQYFPTTPKENHMSDRQLRTPEGPIETKDLTVALRALGTYDLDYILDAVSLVQSLESNQRLVKASKLKQQDVGSHLQVVDGQGGVLTDLRDYESFGRQNNGAVKAVVGGKMLDLREGEFVVLTALAN